MSELRTIARHAGTVLVGQLAVMAYGIADTIVAGRYSQQALAALSVGSAVYITVFVAFIGVLQALLPAWAELHGASAGAALGRSVRQSLYLVGAGSAVGVVCLLFPGPLLTWTEVPEQLQGDVRAYLSMLTLALPAALAFRAFSTLNQSLGRPKLITWLQLMSLALKVPLSIWFAFGGLGVPAMGVQGCALASVLVFWVLVGMAIWLLRTQDLYTPYAIWKRIEPPHGPTLADFARLGIPSGLSVLVEVTSFTLMALFIARQGTTAAAAHQVTSNVAAVMFMMPLSLAIATSARVSYWLGAGDPKLARHAIRTGLKAGAVMMVTYSTLLFLARERIAHIYSTDPEVVAVAIGLLGWLALFHLGDATQGLIVFILRSYRVTLAPLVAYSVLLWGVGLGGGFLLAYRGIGPWPAMQSPAAFWIAATVSLALLALILPPILWRAVRRYRPA
ncbi:MATE family efflux transporter [Ramlibacter albus]|uniref:Multidrug-efflux transporter n=1 Tax=Ramlibacter albus TaxID=2079448 RepID=A0A923S473_9BURK|nr:MATE family efflux transporter [Ramlibacter albus]MBC5766613.1 MATE family efflux transporter [Ramlibacter albus]